ncbi:bifunctional acetate--CoA ligase family protein/GNAT family N-acetyltransferase [Actinokineospora sp. NPDC004072]
MTATAVHWARCRDGGAVEIRRLGAADEDALRLLHAALPPEDRYLRFFTLGRSNAEQYVRSLTDPDHARPAVGAFRDGALLGAASYARTGPGVAEFAVSVAHHDQAHGIGTLLLQNLVERARADGVTTLTADVLTANHRMLRVLDDLGLPVRTERDDDVIRITMPLDEDSASLDAYLTAVDHRARTAVVAGMVPLLRPVSVAVIGAGRRADSVGHVVLVNIRRGGFPGQLTAVNPHARSIAGVPCVPSVADLAEPPELAVVCVPAPAVPRVVRECAAVGVRALVVVTAGLSAADSAAVSEVVREHGMRMVGPNCLGVANPLARLDATFMDRPPLPGRVGLACQSGGIAIGLVRELSRVGIGVSTLVSTGDKIDISGNDLLHWWSADDGTDAAVLYLESFGDPRRFARLARALARRKPLVAIRAGVSAEGSRAAGSHTAALATPAATADALYRQAGITAVDSTAEAVEVLALLLDQPLPLGRRTAVVTNAGGAGVLAADSCAAAGLPVAALGESTVRRLRARLPATAAVGNPVDTTAVVTADAFAECVAAVLADPGVDAVVAITVPTALGDPGTAIDRVAKAALELGKPLVGVRIGQESPVEAGVPPRYADPAAAVRAIAAAADRRSWLDRRAVRVAQPADFDGGAVAALVADRLAEHPEGVWLDPADSLTLLTAAGIPVVAGETVPDADAAVDFWRRVGVPVVVKAVTGGLLHKSRAGGVLLDLRTEADVRAAVAALRDRFDAGLRSVFVQPMVGRGPELLIGVRNDPRFGPLVAFGAGGTDAEALDDQVMRLCPLTEGDIAEMSTAPRIARAHPDPAAADVLRRVARLAETVPELAELDINPLTAGRAVDARARILPTPDS